MRLAALSVALLALSACAPVAELPLAPVPAGPGIVIDATPLPLDRANPDRTRIGRFTYAGGLHLTSRQTARLHGLSDLKVGADGAMIAASDQSDLLRARIVLDAGGRLAGLLDARVTALKDTTGTDLYAGGAREYDSEGIAQLPNGDLLLSFEQHDRILRFPAGGGGLPVPAPAPQIAYIHNKSMEGLAADPAAGPDAYRVAIEATGETFLCRLSAGCTSGFAVDLEGLELTSIDILPDGRMAVLLRGFTVLGGNKVKLELLDRQGRRLDGLEIIRPMTVDNFEGVAAVAGRGGAVRFYLISDDNFGTFNGAPTDQRTLLLAFDWRP